MNFRNREQGWQYTKLSGHQNEFKIAEKLKSDKDYALNLLERIDKAKCLIETINFGGLYEESVYSILGDLTKSKTDLSLFLNSEERVNFSIKKSFGGEFF